jgi:hypothetical protein
MALDEEYWSRQLRVPDLTLSGLGQACRDKQQINAVAGPGLQRDVWNVTRA